MKKVYLDNNFLINLRDNETFIDNFTNTLHKDKYSFYTSFDTLIEQVSDDREKSIANLKKMIVTINEQRINLIHGCKFFAFNNIYNESLENDNFEHLIYKTDNLSIEQYYDLIIKLKNDHKNDAIKWINNKPKYIYNEEEFTFKRDLFVCNIVKNFRNKGLIKKYYNEFNEKQLLESLEVGFGSIDGFASINNYLRDRNHFLRNKENIVINDIRDIQQTFFYHYMDALCLEKKHIIKLNEQKLFDDNMEYYIISKDQVIRV